MKGLTLKENEAELSKMDKCSKKELNIDKSSIRSGSTMLMVVEEVASWPSIKAFEEEYRREQVLGSGRYDDNQSCNIKYLDHQYHIIGTVDGTG